MRVLMAFLLSALASMSMHAANQRDLQRLDETLTNAIAILNVSSSTLTISKLNLKLSLTANNNSGSMTSSSTNITYSNSTLHDIM